MKKTVRRAIALAFVAAMMLSTATVFAAKPPVVVEPNYTYIEIPMCNIELSGSKVVASASVLGTSNATSCSITLTIQKKVGTSWTNVISKTVDRSGNYADIMVSTSAVSGVTYRAKALVTVNRGKITENATVYSGTVTP